MKEKKVADHVYERGLGGVEGFLSSGQVAFLKNELKLYRRISGIERDILWMKKILFASPSDCVEERLAIPEVIYSWNACYSDTLRVVLLPVMWETHSWPELGDRAQSIINKQILKNCDILIGAFWIRLGTPTGVSESGTVEEIDNFRKMEKPVMLYFSEKLVEPGSIDQEQLTRLREFKEKCRKEGLFREYKSMGR